MPIFSGTKSEKVQRILEWVNSNIKRVNWSRDRINRQLGLRTPRQILDSREVFFAVNCFDYVALISQLFTLSNIKHDIRVEEYTVEGEKPSIDAVIEFKVDDKYYSLLTGPFRIEVVKGIRPNSYARRTALGKKRTSRFLWRIKNPQLQWNANALKILGFNSQAHFTRLASISTVEYLRILYGWRSKKNQKMVEQRRKRFGIDGLKTPFLHARGKVK